ncbi:MerC domain-containing protein [Alteriqipengyuania flavescens]|uniref:MerC domain-containing protein n=1 Tax=Alteriqipengyuania flavescens TaxID=3053610 RepID=UPI0025B5186C|nr:MerC domain-containing protein [Alteriqipengyuania flavescens]WJY19623.1 MerC domain-containing protein [Alteriqipengyuania flavescens]WJY25563.1 MerC domain-containing protein [Alteriqipengyuania flavescens]
MTQTQTPIRRRLDRAGIWLSALCAVHCVLSVLLVAGIGLGGSFLLDPIFHEIGLAIAMLIVAVAIGIGAVRHNRPLPFVVAMMGLTFMGGALAVGHGTDEAVLTVIGVTLVAIGHILNLRHSH